MKDFEREMLQSRILELESELGGIRRAAEELVATVLGLRERLDVITARARPVPKAEEEGTVGVMICLDDREWDFVRGAP